MPASHPKAVADHAKTMGAIAKLSPEELHGFFNAFVNLGSRTPTGAPAWVTLEVLHGGFASGRYKAALLDGETPSDEYLRDPSKLLELEEMLVSGQYRLDAPENAALLVVVWLMRSGRKDDAARLLDAIAPWMTQLRFYPLPDVQPLRVGANVALGEVADVRKGLDALIARSSDLNATRIRQRAAQERHAQVLEPLEQALMELVVATFDSRQELFVFEGGVASGRIVSGPWPLQTGMDDPEWRQRVGEVLKRADELKRPRKPWAPPRAGSTMETLMRVLAVAVSTKPAGVKLTGRDVGRVRSIVAHVANKRGLPGTSRRDTYSVAVEKAAPTLSIARFAQVALARLKKRGPHDTYSSMAFLAEPVDSSETDDSAIVGKPMADPVLRIAVRALEAPLDTLIELGAVTSAEAMTPAVTKMVSAQGGSGITDDAVRNLYTQAMNAFASRRSLLLLNLASQVKVHELPWMAPLIAEAKASSEPSQYNQARRQITLLWWRHFPETLLPNTLCKELVRIDAMMLDVHRMPLTEELAADIFANAFSQKFADTAVIAAQKMRGTLYERYFGLQELYEPLVNLNGAKFSAAQFLGAVNKLAIRFGRTPTPSPYSPADGGRTIEAAQIITTHNLAQLLVAAAPLPHGFTFSDAAALVVRRVDKMLQSQPSEWHARLRLKKDVAYAWRQLVFFLSFVDELEERSAIVGQFRKSLEDNRLASAEYVAAIIKDMIAPLEDAMAEREVAKPLLAWYDWKLPQFL